MRSVKAIYDGQTLKYVTNDAQKVVLTCFPFTDLSSSKRRPAIVYPSEKRLLPM